VGPVIDMEVTRRDDHRIYGARRHGSALSVPVKPVLFILLLGAACFPTISRAQSICESCELQLGLGATYHFWGPTGGLVFAATMNWDADRYEVGAFRIAHAQILRDDVYRGGCLMADPYWGFSLSRRWHLFQRGPVEGLFGFGVALRTESDLVSATRWDFASQFALRFQLPGQVAVGELTLRHWSNGGVRLPNHGQDLVTFTIRLNSHRFGPDAASQIPLGHSLASLSP
jgi:hypothetical protein